MRRPACSPASWSPSTTHRAAGSSSGSAGLGPGRLERFASGRRRQGPDRSHRKSLEVIAAFWSGEPVTFQGPHFTLTEAPHAPSRRSRPDHHRRDGEAHPRDGPPPPRLVRPAGQQDRAGRRGPGQGRRRPPLDAEPRHLPRAGADRDKVEALALRRFGQVGRVTGAGPELVEHSARSTDRHRPLLRLVHRFAAPQTLAGFGDEVIATLR